MNTRLNQIQNWPQLAKEANWSVSEMAKKCGLCVRTVERHFLKQMGKSPKEWLGEQRMQQANELLRDGFTVKEVAGRVGYTHASTFSRGFMKYCGFYPTKQFPPPNAKRG